MIDNLFEKAKIKGLQHIKDWLPNGTQKGDEWCCLNPTRNDKTLGSFNVNLKTGKWADMAVGDARGGDAVSLYYYLNQSLCDSRAMQGNYKSLNKGAMTEAAKEIISRYDSCYFPDIKPKITEKKDYWSGYYHVPKGIDNPPELEAKWLGNIIEKVPFISAENKIIMYVVRIIEKDGKKGDRPFTLWTNGTEYKWRAKGFVENRPLYGLDQLAKFPNKQFLLVEGQSCAKAAEILNEEFVIVTWFGGTKSLHKTDFDPLIGRTGYFWPDADATGRLVIKKLKESDINAIVSYPPTGVKKGWDIKDAIQEGWSTEKLIDHITQNTSPYLDDDEAFDFKIVGVTGSEIYFFPKESCQILKYKKHAISKGLLMALMARDKWSNLFITQDGKIAWDAAADKVLRDATKAPIFQNEMLRSTGCWNDNNRIVVNAGNKLIVDGVETDHYNIDSNFIYERKKPVPYYISNDVETPEKFLSVLTSLDWINKNHGFLLAGWCLLAPFGGILSWRPHIWITGSKGSGKSYILDNIVFKIAGIFGPKLLGSSTPAGTRAALGNGSVPACFDEVESDNKNQSENIERLLFLARQASSGTDDGANIVHGSQSGEPVNWKVFSMFEFSSIGAGLKHTADFSRVSVLQLKTPKKKDIDNQTRKFHELQKEIMLFSKEWGAAFAAKTLGKIDEVLKAITIFKNEIGILLENKRDGDQLGTLLAGAYMVCHDEAPTVPQVMDWLHNNIDIENLKSSNDIKTDEENCLDELINIEIYESPGVKYTVGEMLITINDDPTKTSHKPLETVGLKTSNGFLYIAISHNEMARRLKDTGYSHIYSQLINRHPLCDGVQYGPARFAGIQKRYYKINIADIIDVSPF